MIVLGLVFRWWFDAACFLWQGVNVLRGKESVDTWLEDGSQMLQEHILDQLFGWWSSLIKVMWALRFWWQAIRGRFNLWLAQRKYRKDHL